MIPWFNFSIKIDFVRSILKTWKIKNLKKALSNDLNIECNLA